MKEIEKNSLAQKSVARQKLLAGRSLSRDRVSCQEDSAARLELLAEEVYLVS